MKCLQFREQILELARNFDPGPKMENAVHRHMKVCPKCSRRFSEQKRLSTALLNLKLESETLHPPESLDLAITKMFRKRVVRRIKLLRYGRLAALLAAITFLSAFLYRMQTSDQRMIQPSEQQKNSIPSAEFPGTTEFIPLIHGSLPAESIQIIRVRVSRGSLQQLGLPVNEERLGEPVEADVIIGQEGLPYAIRYVTENR